jgi:molybdate transport system ATP-binding protein
MRLQIKHQHAGGAWAVDVDVTLPNTGITVVFGPSGAGKTSLLRCVAGLDRPHVAHIEVAQHLWQHSGQGVFVPTWQRSLGYVFQEPSLFEHMSVQQNLDVGLQAGQLAPGQLHTSAAEVIELLGIAHLLQRMPAQLSGGERQRVAIARALLSQPSLLLLDEPLASIDQARRSEILPWLERLRDQAQVPMLYVTHSTEELLRLVCLKTCWPMPTCHC